MSIIADRGLFVRLLMQSGKFESAAAEAMADSLDAATKDVATRSDVLEVRSDLFEVRNDLRGEIASLRNDVKLDIAASRNELKIDIAAVRNDLKLEIGDIRKDVGAVTDKLLIRLGGLMFVLLGLLFAALRLT